MRKIAAERNYRLMKAAGPGGSCASCKSPDGSSPCWDEGWNNGYNSGFERFRERAGQMILALQYQDPAVPLDLEHIEAEITGMISEEKTALPEAGATGAHQLLDAWTEQRQPSPSTSAPE